MLEEIKKHKNGMFYCVLIEDDYPHSSFVGWGKNDFEAHIKAWELRSKVIEQRMKTKMGLPVKIDNITIVKWL